MIIEFSLANYKSFHQVQTISFRATGLVSEPSVDEKNLFIKGKNKILKIAGIYGANGSGKSNIINAMRFFIRMITKSLEIDELGFAEASPFKLSSDEPDNYGYFQIVLLIKNKRYRYGYTLEEDGNIQSEWLFGPADKNETYYFKRKHAEIISNPDYFKEGLSLPYDKLRSDALFITFCASYDGEKSRLIKDYIVNNVTVENELRILLLRRRLNSKLTNSLLVDGKKQIVLDWMKEAGLVYTDITLKKVQIEPKTTRDFVYVSKDIYNKDGLVTGSIKLDLNTDESDGTQKFYSYIGMLYEKFQNGGIFISDEIDSNFHPSLLNKLICLFQNPSVNKANAQLLFTSHDTNLMNPDFMRRDQFYFTEKTVFEETRLYSLADLKGIRNNADFARQYLAGFYGALPQLGNYIENIKK